MNPHDYTVLIPSRKRPEKAARAMALIPTAKVYVNEDEVSAYARLIPRERIVPHAHRVGLVALRHDMITACETPWLVMCGDDFECVFSYVGRRVRKIEDPASILQLIENMVVMATDGGFRMWCFDRRPNPAQFSAADPFCFTVPVAGIFGVHGKDVLPDLRLSSYCDVDLSLQSLLRDRVILCDRRYYWNFGRVWGGAGGSQGIRTADSEQRDREYIKRKWGAHIHFGTKSKGTVGKMKSVLGMSIRVDRRADIATR